MLQKILSEAEILKRFDALVESGEVRYDKQTEVIEYVDQGFKVGAPILASSFWRNYSTLTIKQQ